MESAVKRSALALALVLTSCASPNAPEWELVSGCWQSKDQSEKMRLFPKGVTGRKAGFEYTASVEVSENGSPKSLRSLDVEFSLGEMRLYDREIGSWIEDVEVNVAEMTLTTKKLSPYGFPGKVFPAVFKEGRQRTLSRVACPNP